MLSSGMITPPFFVFPGNFTHSFYSLADSCFAKRVNACMPTCLRFVVKKDWWFLLHEKGGFYYLLRSGGSTIPLNLYNHVVRRHSSLRPPIFMVPPFPCVVYDHTRIASYRRWCVRSVGNPPLLLYSEVGKRVRLLALDDRNAELAEGLSSAIDNSYPIYTRIYFLLCHKILFSASMRFFIISPTPVSRKGLMRACRHAYVCCEEGLVVFIA
jgi:hypothetical protein